MKIIATSIMFSIFLLSAFPNNSFAQKEEVTALQMPYHSTGTASKVTIGGIE